MSNQEAKVTLLRVRDELVRDIAFSGKAGGAGRAGAYAPQLVHIQGAIDVIDRLIQAEEIKVPALKTNSERMAEVRAHKTA